MDIEVLVSTMNLKNMEEIKKLKCEMNIHTKSVFINQITKNNIKEFKIKEEDANIFSIKEKGLSKSRNKAIKEAQADICVIADDDIIYQNDYESTIKNAYEKYPKVDIICFWVPSLNQKRQTTNQKTKRINYLTSMKISSYQITFKTNSIKNANIKFDENFGAGSDKYVMGEENIFLFDCLRRGLKIMFVEQEIAKVKQEESTWFKGYNEQYFISKGACFYRMSHFFSNIFIIQFAIRKRNLFKNNYNIIETIRIMMKGKKEYKYLVK